MEGGVYNFSNTDDTQDVQDNFGKQSLNFIGESLPIVTVPSENHHHLSQQNCIFVSGLHFNTYFGYILSFILKSNHLLVTSLILVRSETCLSSVCLLLSKSLLRAKSPYLLS